MLSAALLLEHLGRTKAVPALSEAARKIEEAVEADLAERAENPAPSMRSTSEIGDALASKVAGL